MSPSLSKKIVFSFFEALAHQTAWNEDWIQRKIAFADISEDLTSFSPIFPIGLTQRYFDQINGLINYDEVQFNDSEEERFLEEIANLVEKYCITHCFWYVSSIPTPQPGVILVNDRFGIGFITPFNDLLTAELKIHDPYQ